MALKLEVGKTYKTRSGNPVRIVSADTVGKFPFQGDNDCFYEPDGRWWYTGEYPVDLVSEVFPTQNQFLAEARTQSVALSCVMAAVEAGV